MKLTELVEEYLTLNYLRPASSHMYRRVVGTFTVTETIGNPDVEIHELTAEKLARWRDELIHKRKCRVTTYNTYRKHLNVLFRHAVKRGYLARNPLELVGRVPAPEPLPRCIDFATFDQAMMRLNVEDMEHPSASGAKRLQSLQPAWYWQAVLRVLLVTGMRRSQLVGLQWGDIDFARSTIRLRQETSKNHCEYQIPLFDQIRGDLLRLKQEALRVRGRLADKDQVFDCVAFRNRRRYRGGRTTLSLTDLGNFFRALSRELAIKLSSHRLRHTAATELARSVSDLRDLQRLLGHRSERTTFRYIRGNVDAVRELWNKRIAAGGVSRFVDITPRAEAH